MIFVLMVDFALPLPLNRGPLLSSVVKIVGNAAAGDVDLAIAAVEAAGIAVGIALAFVTVAADAVGSAIGFDCTLFLAPTRRLLLLLST